MAARDPVAIRRYQHLRTLREIRRRVLALYAPGRSWPNVHDAAKAIDAVSFEDTRRTENDEPLEAWIDGHTRFERALDSIPETDPMVRLSRWLRSTFNLK